MQKSVRPLFIVLTALTVIFTAILPCFAVDTINENQSNQIKSCANNGDWLNYPENSVEAVSNCNTDYISIDVKLTSDGVPVLMEDLTIDRMCVDKNGSPASGDVKSLTFNQLQAFNLRDGHGGPASQATEYKIASLSDVLKGAIDKELIIDCSADEIDVIDAVVKEHNASERVIYRPDKITDDIQASYNNLIIKYNGNIIFSVISAINKAKISELKAVELGTKNQYGVVFYKSVTKLFDKSSLNAIFSTVGEYSGKRPDNRTGWDDVVTRGYNIIETNHPELLDEYINDISEQKALLGGLLDKYSGYNGSQFKKEYENAKSVYQSAASLSELESAYTSLYESLNAPEEQTSSSLGQLTLSPGRIIAIVLCLIAVVSAQIFFYKRRQSSTDIK